MKRLLIDAAIAFGATFLFAYAKLFLASGIEHADKWLLPCLYGLYFGAICLVIFEVTVRVARSLALFCAVSWLAVTGLLVFGILGALEANLTLRELGIDVFVDGRITFGGVLYKLFDPLGLMAVAATVLFMRKTFKRKTPEKPD